LTTGTGIDFAAVLCLLELGMFYRVVMQGRTVGGAELATVKREFVRVTGLPVRVADEMFGGMPKVIKGKLPEADAERIAATLRAIGAAATIEREVGVADDDASDEGIEIIAAPLSGPPTVIPGMGPPDPAPAPSRKMAWLRDLGEKWPMLLGTLAVAGAAVYFAPEVSGWVSSLRPSEEVAKPKAPPRPSAADGAEAQVHFNASLLHGPWRCVDQRTGLGMYWSYGADGALVFHGEVLSDRPAADGAAATAWRLEGVKLTHTHDQGDVEAYKVAFLSLSRLRYLGERGLEIECRRP
jgi:hypothetical protein